MHAYLRVTALAAILLVTQQSCGTTTDEPTASASTRTSASASVGPSASAASGVGGAPTTSPAVAKTTQASAAGSGPLSGARQVYFYVLNDGQEVPESSLAVSSSGRVEVTEDYSGRALFVPTPSGSKYLIKTGTLRAGGEALCLKARISGSNPVTIVTGDCDAGDKNQLFTFLKQGKDNQGRMTYAIGNGDAFLQWNPTGTFGLIAEELGDAKLHTTFVAIDRGKSTVPALD